MAEHPFLSRKNYPIPGVLNVSIFLLSASLSIGILWLAGQQVTWWGLLICAVGFSFVNNTVFSLLHEATHGNFHSNIKINNTFGRFAAALFPTSFSMQQVYHLGHHRRNRTDAEMFDLYYPGDNLLIKKIIIYGTVLGFYWTTPFISCILFFLSPKWILSPRIKNSPFLVSLSADHMLGGLEKIVIKAWLVRLEIILTIGVQLSIFYFLNLDFWSWIVCYWAFGINWGGLQYADHVNSARNIREGAWNLKVNPLVRWIFLNYHLHLVHHRYPNMSWIYLPRLRNSQDPMPTYGKKFWEFLSGPRPAQTPCPTLDRDLETAIYDGIFDKFDDLEQNKEAQI